MKLNISIKLAISLALLISFFVFALLVLFSGLPDFTIIIFTLLLFVFSFAVIYVSFRNYISSHLRLIFKLIYKDESSIKTPVSLKKLVKDAQQWKEDQKQDIDNLQKQNNYRKEFIGNLSHELKTPLFSIQGYIETLLDGAIDDSNINRAYLKKAVDNVERLSAIVKDVDTIAKVESDALNLEKVRFNMYDLVKETCENLELIADKNDVDLTIEEQGKSLKVFADKEKIRAVLVNLIANSIKYGKEDGKTKIAISSADDIVIVEISDNGIGIKEDQLPRVFERFYRVDSNRSREQGGSGLGLAIVKHIIEAHKQTINLKSIYGKGTTCYFTLAKA